MAVGIPTLDRSLLAAAREGRLVLFLGAGASLGAKNKKGEIIPGGYELGQMIVEKFLRPEHAKLDFKTICDFACAESSVRDVQKFIHDVFIDFEPTTAHNEIPKFVWAGIAGTNYDLLIERSYSDLGRLQKIVPYTKNRSGSIDRLDGDQILYIKLHGCITDYEDIESPLVASTEQLIRSGQSRSNLFKQFLEWGQNQTLVFVGYGMGDSNLRTLIDSLVAEGDSRRRHFLVRPTFDAVEAKYWTERRIYPIATDLGGFLDALGRALPEATRILASAVSQMRVSTITKFISVSGGRESDGLLSYLSMSLEHVSLELSGSIGSAERFYAGFDQGWFPIEHNLDVRRRATDTLIKQCILPAETPDTQKFYLLKAHAGAGKTITLRRVAWEAAKTYDKLVFFLTAVGNLDIRYLEELTKLTNRAIHCLSMMREIAWTS